MLSIFLLLSADSFATPRTTNYVFPNGRKIVIKNYEGKNFVTKNLGLSRIDFVDPKTNKVTMITRSPRAQFFVIPQDSDALSKFVLVSDGSITDLVRDDGQVFRMKWKGDEINSWRGASVTYRGQDYFLISKLKTNGDISTSVVRSRDGREAVYLDKYTQFSRESYEVPQDGLFRLDQESEAFDFKRFDELASAPQDIVHDRAWALRSQKTVIDIVVDHLKQKVFGQDHLVRRFAHYVVNRPVPGRPVVLSVTGPSGVGKTLLGESLAAEVFGNPANFYEMNGAKYMAEIRGGNIEHHNEFGAPAGQQGRQKGGLIEKIKETDGRLVVLINEADKMHPDMWKMLMEFVDRGYIKSGVGREFNAKELYVILTSNRGATQMFPAGMESWSQAEIDKRLENMTSDAVKNLYMSQGAGEEKSYLPREVINRVTEWLAAGPISKETAIKIAAAEAKKFQQTLKDDYGVSMSIDQNVIEHLALTNFKSTDDGRQIRNQVIRYLGESRQSAGANWPLVEGAEIHLSLAAGREKLLLQWPNGPASTKEITVAAPLAKEANPLNEPETVAAIKRLEPTLKEKIVGQDAAISSAVEAIQAQKSDPNRKRPVSLFVVGSTGTGKTEFARSIATALYHSPDRASIISLSTVMNEANLNRIFGSDPGYQGSQTVREFEQALINSPEGGVIAFDEASNMGGNDKGMKAALFKTFYQITEEGTWKSPINNKVYDLSKHVFVFTGNDGERLFQGYSADDVRLAIWQQNRSQEKVRQMLIETGVPEPFLERMAGVILFKPLTRAEMNFIVNKLLSKRIQDLETQYAGVKIVTAPTFIDAISDTFFYSSGGGRTVRKFIEENIPAAVSKVFIESGLNLKALGARQLELHIGVRDNVTKKPYVFTGAPDRKVSLDVQLIEGQTTVAANSVDLTDSAAVVRLMNVRGAGLVSYHEAGHAVMNDVKVTGETLSQISILGGSAPNGDYLGYARYDQIKGHQFLPTRESVIIKIAQLYAGQMAQVMAGYPETGNWSDDLSKIRALADRAFLEWGFDKSLLSVSVDKDGKPVLNDSEKAYLKKKKDELIEEGRRYCEKTLIEKWGLVRVIVTELLKAGTINGARYNELAKLQNERGLSARQSQAQAQAILRAKTYNTCESMLTGAD